MTHVMRLLLLASSACVAVAGVAAQGSSGTPPRGGSYNERMAATPELEHDPVADSVYAAGRRALNARNYAEAIAAFTVVGDRHPLARVAPNAWYWRGYALYRRGEDSRDVKSLLAARDVLAMHQVLYDAAFTRGDVVELMLRVTTALAAFGDSVAEAAVRVARVEADHVIECGATLPAAHARAMADLAALPPEDAARTFGVMLFGQGVCLDVSGVAPLYARLAQSGSRGGREIVIAALGRSVHPSAIEQLLNIVRTERDARLVALADVWLRVRAR